MNTPTVLRAIPRHDIELREGAYDTWVVTGRNLAETARELNIAVTTVRHWAKVDRWRQRHAAERFPVERHEAYGLIASNLMAAAIFASEQVKDHFDPDVPFRFTDKVSLDAAMGTVDRAGFGPVRVAAAPSLTEDGQQSRRDLTPEELAKLSPTDLRALEQGRSVTLPDQRNQDAIIEVKPAR